MTKIKCKYCNSKNTETKKVNKIYLRDIKNPRKELIATYILCNSCIRHSTVYTGGSRALGALATPRLLDKVYMMVKQGKGNKAISAAIGYRLSPSTIHDYYHIRDGQLCDMRLQTKAQTKSTK